MIMRSESKMLRFGFVATLVCLLTGAAVYYLSYWIIVSNVKDSLMEISRQGADRVSDSLKQYLSALESIAKLNELHNPNAKWEEKQHIIEAIAQRNYRQLQRISIADAHGFSRTSDGRVLYVGDRPYFKRAIAGESVVSDPMISRVNQKMVIVFAVPVYHDDKIVSVLYATHSVEALSNITNDITMGKSGYAFIINQQGDTIAHPDSSLVYARDNDFVNIKNNPELKSLVVLEKKMVRGMMGAGEYTYHGQRKFLGFAPIAGTGWSLAMTAPRQEVFRNLDFILLVFSLLFFVILFVFMGLNLMNLSLRKNLFQKEQFLNRAIDTASILWIELNWRGTVINMNEHAMERLGYTKEDNIRDMTIYDLTPTSFETLIDDLIKRLGRGETVSRFEFPMIKKDDSLVHLLWSATFTRNRMSGSEPTLTLMGVDITDRVQSEQKLLENHQRLSKLFEDLASSEDELRRQYAQLAATQEQLLQSEERYQLAQDGSNDILWDWDVIHDKVYTSDKIEYFLGYPKEHFNTLKTYAMLIHPDDLHPIEEDFRRFTATKQSHFRWEFRIKTISGEDRWVLLRGKAIYSQDKPVRMAGSITDITDRRHQEDLIHQLAYYDTLTGLPNRVSLYQQCELLFQANPAEEPVVHGALYYLDIDNFKLVNDSFGHSIGDKLLIEIGLRIRNLMEGVELFRLGGDEFVLLAKSIHNGSNYQELADRLLAEFSNPFVIAEHIFHIRLSIGVAVFPENGSSMEELLRNADTALYKAKEAGKNQCVFFNRSMNDAIMDKVQMESSLRAAIINQEFFLEYQPQVSTLSGQLVGFEALLRWRSPRTGIVSPARFIPIAEDNGLIIPIGLWVLERACHFVNRLNREGQNQFSISVNISTRQLMQEDFVHRVQKILDDFAIVPGMIGLEITESVLLESFETQVEKLRILKNSGIPIYLDDFGTGYSSLSYLKKLPITAVKIDKSFVADIKENAEPPLIGSVITLAHQMDLRVIAEGVETPEQWRYLQTHQCDQIQGFLFSKPVGEDEAIDIAKTGSVHPNGFPFLAS